MRRRLLSYFLRGLVLVIWGAGSMTFAQKTYFRMVNLPPGYSVSSLVQGVPAADDTTHFTSIASQSPSDSAYVASGITAFPAPYSIPPLVGTLDLIRYRNLGAQFVLNSNPAYIARTADFTPVPKKLLVQMRIRMDRSSQPVSTDSTIATFYLGTGYTDNASIPADADTYFKLRFKTSTNPNTNYKFRLDGSSTEILTQYNFARITIAINNSDAPIDYVDENGHVGILAPDTYDVWADYDPTATSDPDYLSTLQTFQLIDDAPVTTPAQSMTDFKIYFDPNRRQEFKFVEFRMRSIEGFLPVELMYFNGKVTDEQKVELNWATASEHQSDYFLIERSQDLQNFTEVAKVKAAGMSSQRLTYNTTDEKPLKGTSYYRLTQVDLNGSRHTYRPISVSIDDDTKIDVYPNPSDGEAFYVRTTNPETAIQVHSLSGTPIPVSVTPKGNNELLVTPLARLTQGLYVVSITTPESTQRKKLVIR